MIVECYLDAKYYHYDPVELNDLADFNANLVDLLEEDNIRTVENAAVDKYNLSVSIDENFKELENACPAWQPNTKAVHPKWIEHHQSGHLTKDKNCPVCVKEAGSRVAHWRKKGDCQAGVMLVNLAAFEPSADGRLVAAVTVKADKESKLSPIFVPLPKKDSVSGLAAIKEALTLCSDRNLHQITGWRIVRIQADGGGELNNQ